MLDTISSRILYLCDVGCFVAQQIQIGTDASRGHVGYELQIKLDFNLHHPAAGLQNLLTLLSIGHAEEYLKLYSLDSFTWW